MRQPKQYILEFDHRDDGGPRHVGTFPNRSAALTHIEVVGLLESVWTIQRLTDPKDDFPASGS